MCLNLFSVTRNYPWNIRDWNVHFSLNIYIILPAPQAQGLFGRRIQKVHKNQVLEDYKEAVSSRYSSAVAYKNSQWL